MVNNNNIYANHDQFHEPVSSCGYLKNRKKRLLENMKKYVYLFQYLEKHFWKLQEFW